MSEGNKKLDLSRLKIAQSVNSTISSQQIPTYIWGSIAVIALLILIFIFWPSSSPTPESTPRTLSPAKLAQFEKSHFGNLTATGYVVAQRRAAVASKGTGRLRELKVREGDTVKKDDVIAILENDDVSAQLKQLEAQVNALQSKVEANEAEAIVAKLQHDRMVGMRKGSLASQAELEQSEARYRKALAELASAKSNVALATAQLEKGKVEFEYTYIKAPFDGTVLTKNADVGEVVAPFGSSTNARAAVVTIADMSSLEVEADVSEANISRVRAGQLCEITLDSFPDKKYRGEVNKIVPTVDRAKATVLTKIKFLDIDSSVLPEMSAKVIFSE